MEQYCKRLVVQISPSKCRPGSGIRPDIKTSILPIGYLRPDIRYSQGYSAKLWIFRQSVRIQSDKKYSKSPAFARYSVYRHQAWCTVTEYPVYPWLPWINSCEEGSAWSQYRGGAACARTRRWTRGAGSRRGRGPCIHSLFISGLRIQILGIPEF